MKPEATITLVAVHGQPCGIKHPPGLNCRLRGATHPNYKPDRPPPDRHLLRYRDGIAHGQPESDHPMPTPEARLAYWQSLADQATTGSPEHFEAEYQAQTARNAIRKQMDTHSRHQPPPPEPEPDSPVPATEREHRIYEQCFIAGANHATEKPLPPETPPAQRGSGQEPVDPEYDPQLTARLNAVVELAEQTRRHDCYNIRVCPPGECRESLCPNWQDAVRAADNYQQELSGRAD